MSRFSGAAAEGPGIGATEPSGAVSEEWSEAASTAPAADADFDRMPTEVRVAAGTTAYLSCRPRSLRNKTVSLISALFTSFT